MSIIAVGLVGFGLASSVFHAPLLQTSGHFAITHVLERSTSKSQSLNPGPTIVRTIEALVAAPVELIVIASPTGVHFEQAKLALQAKKHVVVDKPACVNSDEVTTLIRIAEEHSVLFTVFHNRRWDSDFLTIQQLIASGRLGDLTHYEAHYDRFRPNLKGVWREHAAPGSGLLYDLGAHLVDQALVLFGPPDNVHADVQIQREGAENDDFFRLELTYAARPGFRVVLTAGMLVAEPGPKYAVVGTRGRVEKHGEDPQEQALRDGRRPGDADWGREPASHFATLTVEGESERVPSAVGQYEAFYANVAAVIREGASLLVDPRLVVTQIGILEEAKRATRVNRQSA